MPVIPATCSSRVGRPQKRAAIGAIAARASATRAWATSSDSSRSTTSAVAPACTAAGAKSCPSVLLPGTQKKSVPAPAFWLS